MSKNNFVFIIAAVMVLFSCSDDSGPGYQEPYDPNPDPTDDDGGQSEIPSLSDDELMDLVQETTFDYFWGFAEANSGMARERSQDDAYGGDAPNIVTTGGTGLGLSSFPAAVERGWISREEALLRLDRILDFLEEVPKYHGAFAHWYMGNTAQTRPFSQLDNGGDLVETAFLIQGLLICRQYFDDAETDSRITEIWENVEWDWYTQGEDVLYWHWSPNFNFQINLPIDGWNESLMTYVLAAASPTHPISRDVYTNGWARGGNMVTNRTHYGINMPLGPAFGGPLFFSHYSFVGLDPRNLVDQYANYWTQNTAHAMINYEYCVRNPRGFEGYGADTWGLTASDNYQGYEAHSPTNDLGVITPTAAISSFPYTPEQSMRAMRHFYEDFDGELWGEYGFYDAFSEEENWISDGYLAIDQAPIVAMIENHRTGMLWELFMADADIQRGLEALNFSY